MNTLSSRKKKAAIAFILPASAVLILFSIVPMAFSFCFSFMKYNTAMAASTIKFSGLSNYFKVLTDKSFQGSVIWTITFTIIVVILNLIIGMSLALALNSGLLPKLSFLLKTIFILPMMIAPIVTATIWKLIFSPIYGVLNQTLVYWGQERVNWFSEVIPARIAIIMVETWATTPLCMLILMAALKTVPEEYIDAARIDGASKVQTFISIVLPCIRNFIILVTTMRFMDSIRMFDIVYNLTNGGPGTSTETLASTIYKMAFRYFDVGEGSAGAVVFFAIIAALSVLFVNVFREKEV